MDDVLLTPDLIQREVVRTMQLLSCVFFALPNWQGFGSEQMQLLDSPMCPAAKERMGDFKVG